MILFTEMIYDGDGRKTEREKKTKANKTKEKIPRLVAPPPCLYDMERFECKYTLTIKPNWIYDSVQMSANTAKRFWIFSKI